MSNFSSNSYTTNSPQLYYSNNNTNTNNNRIANNYTTLPREFILPSFKNLLTTINHAKPITVNEYAYISPANSNDMKYHTGTISPLPLLSQQQQQQQLPVPTSATNTTNPTNVVCYSIPHYIHNPPMQVIRPEQLNSQFLQQQQQQQVQINYNNTISASYPRSLPVYIPNININTNQQQQQQQGNVLSPQHVPLTNLKNYSIPTNSTATNIITSTTTTTTPFKKSGVKTINPDDSNKVIKKNNPKIKKKRKQKVMKKNKKISNIKDLLNPISKKPVTSSSSSSSKKCFQCQETNTPEWRLGPYGSRSLCNACGLYYRRLIQRYDLKQANLIMRFNRFVQPTNVRQVPSHIEIPHDIIKQFDMDPTLDNNYNTIN